MIDFAKDWNTFDYENDIVDSFDLYSFNWYDVKTNNIFKNNCFDCIKIEL